MKAISLSVNGELVSANVEPRTQLADFLRDSLDLTGTHLGCEQGVCGACTLMIDGVPARSCITLAIACEGASITTIEGQDDDEVIHSLREAFTRKHALQCGFCTPGMLASARDIVVRMPDATLEDIRVAMSGNLCRCTGYGGIVHAVHAVLVDRKAQRLPPPRELNTPIGPAGSGHAIGIRTVGVVETRPAGQASAQPSPSTFTPITGRFKPQSTLQQSFTIKYPRERVWRFFGDLGAVTTCLPGTSLLRPATDSQVEVKIRIKLGPIVAEFEGVAQVTRDALNYSGTIVGHARDNRSNSATRGEIRYVLDEEEGGSATRVRLDVGFALTGSLAQLGRSGIVQDVAARMTDVFSKNLQTSLDQGSVTGHSPALARDPDRDQFDAGSLIFAVFWGRIKAFFRNLF